MPHLAGSAVGADQRGEVRGASWFTNCAPARGTGGRREPGEYPRADVRVSQPPESAGSGSRAPGKGRSRGATAKAVAWGCLRPSFQPRPASIDAVKAALGSDGEALLDYLEDRLGLVVTLREDRDQIRFALDPLAEYPAALQVVEKCRGDDYAWPALFAQGRCARWSPAYDPGVYAGGTRLLPVETRRSRDPGLGIGELAKRCGIAGEAAEAVSG